MSAVNTRDVQPTERFAPEALERWVARVFETCRVPADHARQAAMLLVQSEMRGYGTHGLTRVPSYVERLQAGDFNPAPRMTSRRAPGALVIDADGAMGHVAAPHAIRLGLDALESNACLFIALQSCGHLGALGVHALMAADAGAFCMIGQRTPPLLAMQGFSRAAIGHNPIAFGCPRGAGRPPIVFDMACSVAARGHILLAAREGRPIPEGWAVDAHGNPTTSADEALKGSLQPMGDHKGIGIAMMVECLAGALTATVGSLDPARNHVGQAGAVGRQGAFLLLVKPDAFAERALFDAYMTRWTGIYLDAAGSSARLPGARGAELERAAREHGIAIPVAIERELCALGDRLGVPLQS